MFNSNKINFILILKSPKFILLEKTKNIKIENNAIVIKCFMQKKKKKENIIMMKNQLLKIIINYKKRHFRLSA